MAMARARVRARPRGSASRCCRSARGRAAVPLVCLPFAGGSGRAYTPLLRCLPRTWTVVTGQADYGPGASLASAADAWWTAAGQWLRPGSVLFGHSLGGALAAELVRRHGGRLTGVRVVVSAPPIRLPDPLLAAVGKGDDDTLLDMLADYGLLPAAGLTRDELSRLVAPRFVNDFQVVRDGWPAHPPATPVTMLAGSDDPMCRPDEVRALLADWPIDDLHVVRGGHYFCVENPERTAELLRQIGE